MRVLIRRSVLVSVLVLLAALGVFWALGGEARGATLTVTSTGDSGAGSLRQAILDAASGDTIEFAVTGTITLTSGELAISKSLTIKGPGSSHLTISGNNASRVFVNTADATIAGVAICNGNSGAGPGGGVMNTGILTISSSVVCLNRTNSSFPGGGGIFNQGTLTLADSTVSGNAAFTTTPFDFVDGGGISNFGTLIVTGSAISGNWASDTGGGIYNQGTALTLVNSTISGNFAGDTTNEGSGAGGGIRHVTNTGTLTLTNSTIVGNISRQGSGIFSTVAGRILMTNTIIAKNLFGGNCLASVLTSLGNNLDSDGTCNLTATGDLRNIDPMLGPLQNNGGPTLTHALLAGSPAIDTGDDTAAPHTDQRGVLRPQGLASDIGAYEFHDTLSPNCALASLSRQWVRISVRDGGSGLASIALVEAHNVDVSIPRFPLGTREPVTVTGKRRNAWPPYVHLQVTDLHGNVADCKL